MAHNTQDTVAVVNQIQVMAPSITDFQPIIAGLLEQWRNLLRTIPSIIFGLLILVITWFAVKGITFLVRLFLKSRLKNPLLQRVIIWGVGLGISLIGLYTVFHLMGLTDIALTVIGELVCWVLSWELLLKILQKIFWPVFFLVLTILFTEGI